MTHCLVTLDPQALKMLVKKVAVVISSRIYFEAIIDVTDKHVDDGRLFFRHWVVECVEKNLSVICDEEAEISLGIWLAYHFAAADYEAVTPKPLADGGVSPMYH